MSSKHRREREDRSALSHADRAKLAIRQAFQQTSINDPTKHDQYNLHLYENDRQERINEIADDEDGDLLVERQPLQPALIEPDRSSKMIEANDRRHDAVIFGDKAVEGKSPGEDWRRINSCLLHIVEQQRNQMRDSFKQSSKYSTTSLSGPLLLEDPATKRLRWRTKMHELWIKRYGGATNSQTSDMDVVWVQLFFSLLRSSVNKRVWTHGSWSMWFSDHLMSFSLFSLQMSSEYYCVPGDRLCASDRALSGAGTYEKQNCIYASLAGTIRLATVDQSSTSNEKKPTISVERQDRILAVPSVGSLAYCKVTNVTSRFVRCLMFAINNQPMKTPCHGRINRENIESINKDAVVCSAKFRPDDIVLARKCSKQTFPDW